MTTICYFLHKEEYTIRNALFWGNFKLHAQKAMQSSWKDRVVHLIVCIFEAPPIIGQIASLFEMVIGRCVLSRIRRKSSLDLWMNETESVEKLSSIQEGPPKLEAYAYVENLDDSPDSLNDA